MDCICRASCLAFLVPSWEKLQIIGEFCCLVVRLQGKYANISDVEFVCCVYKTNLVWQFFLSLESSITSLLGQYLPAYLASLFGCGHLDSRLMKRTSTLPSEAGGTFPSNDALDRMANGNGSLNFQCRLLFISSGLVSPNSA